MHISQFNKVIQDAMPFVEWKKNYRRLRADNEKINQRLVAKEDGHLVAAYPFPVFLPFEYYRELQDASDNLLGIQYKMLKKIIDTMPPEEILNLFSIPAYLKTFIDWERLYSAPPTLGRMDIVFDDDGRPLICEFNIDSSIGGGDFYAYIEHAKTAVPGLFPEGCHFDSFYESLAGHLIALAEEHDKSEIGLFMWHTWLHKGLYNYRYLMDHVEAKGFKICKITESDIKNGKNFMENKLMFRALAKEHMVDDLDFMKNLFDRGMYLISDFGDEIYCSKIWYGLLCDETYAAGLTLNEKKMIATYIPHTRLIDKENLNELIKEKNHWIFKPVDAYGGKGILIGEETIEDEIRKGIKEHERTWIAQEFIKGSEILLPDGENRDYLKFHAVFGLFKVAKEYSGMSLRLSNATKIVNISGGKSLAAWAIPVEKGNVSI